MSIDTTICEICDIKKPCSIKPFACLAFNGYKKQILAEVLKATAKCKKYVEVVEMGTLTKNEVVEETVAISELLSKLEGK